MNEPAYSITPMRPADIDDVMRVEIACFPNPWAPNTFLQELERAQAHIDVLRRNADAQVVGFINHWVVLDELHLLNVAIHPDERRRGHARKLIQHMLAFGRQAACRVVMLEVRRSNEAALALYREFGFRSVGVRPGYYSDNGEDAILMNLDLPPSP
ncbi:MAG: ribosomal protein S18-alanine N-acetyltransferase [Deltaproteobacteria bacterium]|nr:ribosomal protein S18-alanine N-acetyltransferase [Deltaproteobacteria bacterium]